MFGITKGKNETHVLSNVPSEEGKIARQAAIETGHHIVINPKATTVHGQVILGFVAIETMEKKDFGDFWKRFRELKNERR